MESVAVYDCATPIEELVYSGKGVYAEYYTPEELLRFLVLRYGSYLSLELGPGRGKGRLAGIGLSERADPAADIWIDLNLGIPLPGECVDEIYSNQFLEHLRKERQVFFWNEMWRVLKHDGKMEHHVPHYLSPHAVGDPTHNTMYSETSFQYYCLDQSGRPFVESFSDYGITARFVLDELCFESGRHGLCVKMHKA